MVGLIIEWVVGFCKFCRVLRCGPGLGFRPIWAFDSRFDLFRSGLVPLAMFDVFELFLVSFESFGGRNARDVILEHRLACSVLELACSR